MADTFDPIAFEWLNFPTGWNQKTFPWPRSWDGPDISTSQIFLRTRLPHPAIIRALNKLPCPRSGAPRSGYRGSDLVLWH